MLEMLSIILKKYGSLILVGVFFFYLGVISNFLRLDCVDHIATSFRDEEMFNTDEQTNYAVIILTSPENELQRNAIRGSWGKLASKVWWTDTEDKRVQPGIRRPDIKTFIKLYFVIGTQSLNDISAAKLQTENRRSKDLLFLENVKDSYQNLTFKVLQTFRWLIQNLKQLKYVIKVDDDSFVRVDLIVKDIENFAPEMNGLGIKEYVSYKNNLSVYKGLYWGYFMGRANVYLRGKWQEKKWFLCDHYLPYALGGGYVISHSIVDYIARNADFLTQYHSEDVSMGVWTAALDGIHRVHDIRFDTEWISRGCYNNMLVRHKQTPEDMIQMYQTLIESQGRKICETETTLRKSYRYNWTVLPSKCCYA